MFQGLDDRAAARHEQHLCQLDELATKELEMLIDGSDESASGQAGDDEVDIMDMVSVHMGSLELKSKGGNGEDESDNVEDKLVEEDSTKLKVKGKGQAERKPKCRRVPQPVCLSRRFGRVRRAVTRLLNHSRCAISFSKIINCCLHILGHQSLQDM